jgi:sugar lactone lactonase YvrE
MSEPAPGTSNVRETPEVRVTPSGRRTLLRLFLGLIVALSLGIAVLLLSPSPIDPVAFEPEPALPLTGALAPNTKLREAEPLAVGKIVGPEDIETDAQGRIYTGLADGRIVRVTPEGQIEEFVSTGGRPVGIEFDRDGNLIVADAVKGLLQITPDGTITTLVTEADGAPVHFADDLDIDNEGVIYFSDASTKFGNGEYLYDLLEGRPHGRLISHDRRTGETKVLLDNLYFANGIALSQDESFLLVNETYRYRIQRYWLKGPRAGTAEIFIDKLPGFPDNITSNRQGKFWCALFTVRNATNDWLSPRPFVKSLVAKLPKPFWPAPDPYAFVIALDEQGNILESLQDPGGEKFHEITSAHERDGYLYLGSLSNDRIGRYRLPAASDASHEQ